MKKILIALTCFVLVVLIAVAVDAAAFSNYVGKQTVRLYNEFLFYNTTGTKVFGIANTGAITVGSVTAGIDSFSTTTNRKAIAITGALAADVYYVTFRANAAQGEPFAFTMDSTNIAYYAKADSLIVLRVPNNGQKGLSGANFSWVRFSK